jgi:hypothetical protein
MCDKHGQPRTDQQMSHRRTNVFDAKQSLEQDLEQRIQERAYLMWEMEGKPEGREDEYWHRARERIEAETQSAYPPAQSRGHRT